MPAISRWPPRRSGAQNRESRGSRRSAGINGAGLEAGAAGVLAFKQLTVDDHSEAPWRIDLATELLESWLRAETFAFVNVGETLVTGRTVVRYDVQNAPTREFRFRTPAAWRNVEIVGAGVRRRDLATDEWRIELQNKVLANIG